MQIIVFLLALTILFNIVVAITAFLKTKRKDAVVFFAIYLLGDILWTAGILYAILHARETVFLPGSTVFEVMKLVFLAPLILLVAQNLFIQTLLGGVKLMKTKFNYFILALTIITASIILFDNTLFSSVKVYFEGYIEVARGFMKIPYSLLVVFYYFYPFFIVKKNLKKLDDELSKKRIRLLLWTHGIVYGSGMITNMILSAFLGMPQLTGIGPIFSLITAAFFVYAVTRYRFLDIKFVISKTVKIAIALLSAFGTAYLLPRFLGIFLTGKYITYLNPFSLIAALAVYLSSIRFFNSDKFHRFFGISNVEYFRATIKEFRNKNIIYTNVHELRKDLHEIFSVKLRVDFVDVLLWDDESRKKFPRLLKFVSQSSETLVLKELLFLSQNNPIKKMLAQEIEKLGEVIVPLFQPSREPIGLLLLGKKVFGDPYYVGEIEALQRAQSHLSLRLTGAIFNSQLKKEVRRKTESLKKQNERIRELMRQQADFIAVSAHELRTPLSIAILQTEMLEASLANSDKEDDARNASEALHKLQDLVQKLFTVQKFDIKKVDLSLRKIRLSDFLAKIFRDFEAVMREKAIDFRLENKLNLNFTVALDPLQIRQVLQNVLSNAVKFTPRNGRVVLRAEQHGENVLLAIRNSGSLIPDQDKKAIFEKFRSLRNSKSKGLGLGLYLAKKIIELHRGKIWVEDVDRETEFRIQLPSNV
ncbi:MAG: HAMP domain-containing sensor histidine kinase [Patescibacteria group bacterium]